MRPLLLAAMLACLTGGCAAVTKIAYNPTDGARIRSVVVLPFDDSSVSDQAADYGVAGYTSETGAGRVVSKLFAQALEEENACQVLRGTALSMACLEHKLEYSKLAAMDPAEVGRGLGVDGVVRGKVKAFRQTWGIALAKAEVAFQVECIDAATGKVAWYAEADGYLVKGVESDLALEASRRIARRVAERKPAAEAPAPAETAPAAAPAE